MRDLVNSRAGKEHLHFMHDRLISPTFRVELAAPDGGALVLVTQDVVRDVHLMGTVVDRNTLGALRPEAFRTRCIQGAENVGRVLLGAAEMLARLVVAEPGEDVKMMIVQLGDDRFDLRAGETGDEFAQTRGRKSPAMWTGSRFIRRLERWWRSS
jgi:hypothetical protein